MEVAPGHSRSRRKSAFGYFLDSFEGIDIEKLGSQLERHPGFPGGTNVEFVVVKQGKVQVKVWERGAGVTPACGLGASAVASWIIFS